MPRITDAADLLHLREGQGLELGLGQIGVQVVLQVPLDDSLVAVLAHLAGGEQVELRPGSSSVLAINAAFVPLNTLSSA
ncbi:TPA: hypothetical protein UMX25_000193 [Stenotrophomonas maltophilia]|uniref:hypothetical protein n=1 Tax=Stenotrophomonas maltophilia TaxID=40324 RepID=UPI002A93DD69|nr:hypothetical protein [Stenotrophomonas maltophilia]HEL4225306.1 hypothetical protein [Stenotrophomonas maltophilia]